MEEVLNYLNNYFFKFKETGSFEIKDNKILNVKGSYIKGQYLLVEGSIMNDGVVEVISNGENEITLMEAVNEEFNGVIYSLAIPKSLKEIVDKIIEFKGNNKNTDIISESFEGYSYSKATNSNGQAYTWKDAFKEELRGYRKLTSSKRLVKEVEK